MEKLNICPWSLLENKIYLFEKNNQETTFLDIIDFLKNNSSHGIFWENVFDLNNQQILYKSKYLKCLELIKYLENENEQLYKIIELNEQKKTSK